MANRNKKTADKYAQSKERDNGESLSVRGGKDCKRRPDNKFHKNDISWYATDPQILNDVARIPYSIPVGYPMTRRGTLTEDLVPAVYDDAIPGIASMDIIPTIGNAEYAHDAVNVAANGMYTFVRHLNSGSRNYDANDLVLYCMSVNSCYYMIAWATRLYATLQLYAQGNRYLPDALLRAQGIDPKDLRANMAQYRAGVNQAIRKISTLVVPAVLPIFARHSWLFSNYFIEGESIKDQVYMFTPKAWYKFTKDQDEAGMLKCYYLRGSHTVGTQNNLLGADDIINILNDMIDPIFADEDFNIISGDILKAYGESNILKLALIPDELPIGLAWNEEVLLQFKNAKVQEVRTEDDATQIAIHQTTFQDNMFDTVQSAGKSYLEVIRSSAAIMKVRDFDGSIIHSASANYTAKLTRQAMFNEWSKPTLLSSPHADVQPAENMINTRLTLAFDLEYYKDDDEPANTRVNHMYFGSEWPLAVHYWVYHKEKETGTNALFSRYFSRVMRISPSVTNSVKNCVTSYLPVRSAFKYAPECSIIENDSYQDGDGNHVIINETGRSLFEVDNYTLVNSDVISMLHNAAIQGEYNIPRVALFPTK